MEEYNLQIRDSMDDHIEQWVTVRQLKLQGFLFKSRDQKPILIPRTPTSERIDGGDEPDTDQDHQS